MNKPINIYIEILKFGREKLNDGLQLNSLVEYLNNKDFLFHPPQEVTIHTAALINIFINSFQDREGKSISDIEEVKRRTDTYYLKTEALAYLLSYESLEQAKDDSAEARKEAKQAIYEAKRAYWLAFVTLLVSSVLAIISFFYQPTQGILTHSMPIPIQTIPTVQRLVKSASASPRKNLPPKKTTCPRMGECPICSLPASLPGSSLKSFTKRFFNARPS